MPRSRALKALDAKRRAQLRTQARRHALRGVSRAEIARRLSLPRAAVDELLAAKRRYGPSDLDPDAWAEYLAELVEDDGDGQRLVRGRPLEDPYARAFFRWTEERCAANFFSADRWLCAFDLHIDGFFAWCAERGRCPWARGVEPEWHRLPASRPWANGKRPVNGLP